jgi:glycosyltransferase 2 family protein
MRIRVVKTASNTKAVQAVRYQNNKRIIVRHLGSSHTEEELKELLFLANEWLKDFSGQIPIFPEDNPNQLLHVDYCSFIGVYNTFLIMMSGYLVNTIVPRLGEFTKPAFMSKKEKVPFSVTLGTIVVERLADLIMLFLLIFFVITTQHDLLYNFFAHDIFAPIIEKFTSSDGESSNKKWYIIGAIVLIAGYWGWNYLDKKTKDEKSADKINEFADNMMMGLTSFQKLKSKTLFLGYTLLIWVLYFFMTYTCFFSLEATSGLSVAAGVALVTIGSLGRSVPVQAGGMGAYHWIISSALVLYAINKESGLALATIIHAAQTLFYLVLGGISMLIISVTKDA